jgi:transposase InsO family protein
MHGKGGNRAGMRVSRKRVERLMREQKLRAGRHRKYVKTTDSSHGLAVADNILRRFTM